MGRMDLYTWCIQNNRSDLLQEWFIKMNGSLTPKDVTYGTEKSVWWKCSLCGHEWTSRISNRVHGRGCPMCSKRNGAQKKGMTAVLNNGSLKMKHPELVKEWNYSKNVNISPDVIPSNTNKKYWWICQNGHEWQESPNARTKGYGCPYCSGKRAIAGINDIATKYPDLIQEWDYQKNDNYNPNTILPNSNKKVWWLCSEGHSWQALVSNRTIHKQGCPFCVGKRAIIGTNDLATLYPDLMQEWDYTKNEIQPQDILSRSGQKVWWLCLNGHSFQASVVNRVKKQTQCPYCQNRKVLAGFNDLATLYPELVEEWDIEKNDTVSPFEVLPGTAKKVYWKCSNGHSFMKSIVERTAGQGCPICLNKRIQQGDNDLLSTHNNVAQFWHPTKNKELKPFQVVAGSAKTVWWLGECGHEFKSPIRYQCRNNALICPICSKESKTSFPEQVVLYYLKQVFDDVISGDRHLKKELDIYIPSRNVAIEYDGRAWHQNVDRDIEKNQLCIENNIALYRIREEGCPKLETNESIRVFEYDLNDFESLERIINIVLKDLDVKDIPSIDISRDTPEIYARYIFKIKENGIASVYPECIKEWHPMKNGRINPAMVSAGSHNIYWWICPNGHEYQMKAETKARKHIQCPYCTRRLPIVGETDFASENPKLLSEWHYSKNIGLNPQDYMSGSQKKVWWKCETCNTEWEASIYRRVKGHSCPKCGGIKRAKKKSKKVINIDTGKIFDSSKEAAEYYGINNLSACLHGKNKKAGGYRWQFYEG